MTKLSPQQKKIVDHLEAEGSITQLEAWDFYRIRRLATRIFELKEKGYDLTSQRRQDCQGQRYVRYVLETAA